MPIQIKHFGKVQRGVLIYNNAALFRRQLDALEGKEFELVIKERTRKPSSDQYAYYFGAILHVCHQAEMFRHYDNPDQIHEEYFAEKFLCYTKVVPTIGGGKREKQYVKSLSSLTVKEVSEFIDRVVADCAMNGIQILSPEEYYNQNYK